MANPGRLDPLQQRVLAGLAPLPSWTLSGGAALAGFHLGHRTTRGLDLLWHGRADLEGVSGSVRSLLHSAGLESDVLQTSPAFLGLRVSSGERSTVLDLVAEPVAQVDRPIQVEIAGGSISVDSTHEILVKKLCALVHRSELRDLTDVEALLEHGMDLERALRDAPRKDGGFSPLVLLWTLKGLQVEALGRASGLEAGQVARLRAFRDGLVARLAAASKA